MLAGCCRLCGCFFVLLVLLTSSRAATIWTGPNITWTKSGATPSDTIVPGKVVLRRGSSQVLYNTAAGESSANVSTSPKDTLWAFGDIANATTLSYKSLAAYRDGNLAKAIMNKPMVVHLVAEDIYFSIKFTVWGQHGSGTVSYIRSTPPADVPPTVSITSPSEGTSFTAPASFDLTADASVAGGTISSVQFFANGTSLGTATTAPFKITANIPNPGSYALTAVATAAGASATSAAVHITVNPPQAAPVVSITSPSDGEVFTAPADVNVAADASVANGSISSVSFFANGNLIGTTSTAPFNVTASDLAAGNYDLTAVATAGGVSATSGVVHITVTAPQAAPVVSITAPIDGAVFAAPANVSVAVNATVASGSISGVSFFANGSPIGTASTAPFNATASNLAAGSYDLTAIATASGASATSGAVHITVVAPVTVTLSPPAISGGSFSFNYTANAGLTYVVQAASSLNSSGVFNWAPVSTNVATSGTATFSENLIGNSARFFRVALQPNP